MREPTPKWLLSILDMAKVKIDELDSKALSISDRYMCKTPCPCVQVDY